MWGWLVGFKEITSRDHLLDIDEFRRNFNTLDEKLFKNVELFVLAGLSRHIEGVNGDFP